MTEASARPVPPIELAGTRSRLGEPAALPWELLGRLAAICPTSTDVRETAEASRDWWPLAMHWALAGEVAHRAAAVCRPAETAQVAAVVGACHGAGVAVTAAGGRSGVSGGSVPAAGGVILDLTGLTGVVAVDQPSGLVEVRAGTFGPDLEDELRATWGLTVGHLPQSFELATVGGWVACRGAGQYSTRYGKIEDMVAALEVVLSDGSVVRVGDPPAAAVGPDLTQLFVGCEGTLGIITSVTLRAHPVAEVERRAAYAVGTWSAGVETCRRILRRGATPAVLRLYDATETQRSHGGDGSWCALIVLDEGDRVMVEATMQVVAEECAPWRDLGRAPVDAWLAHRNDTSALQALTRKGFVVDTMEVAAPWSRLDHVVDAATSALRSVDHARLASCHLSHSYLDGACLYFTFVATPPPGAVDATYVAMWDAGQGAALAAGATLSHHHGVGLNRHRFVADAHPGALGVLQKLKDALDPAGILNPGKLGLTTTPTRGAAWP